jgi:hypothetical protein
MACLLWEQTFYENGVDIAQRIADLVPEVSQEIASAIAIEARTQMNMRHVPLLIAREMAREGGELVGSTIEAVIQRADELAEFLSIYWIGRKKHTLSAQVKKGLARAFGKFDAYQLAKYNRDGAVKLRDVLFLTHAKPKDEAQALIWKQLIDGKLPVPDTWETALSAGKDKALTFIDLILERKIGGLAMLRNLRNMQQAGVEDVIIRQGIKEMNVSRILPFRFVAAARYAPTLEDALEEAMFKTTAMLPKLPGEVTVLVDTSGSMRDSISEKSDMRRFDAANALAAIIREMSEHAHVYSFSDTIVAIPPRRGFALMDAIMKSQPHSGTQLGAAARACHDAHPKSLLIAITDEQSHDMVVAHDRGYLINVAAYQHGVGYGKGWTHIDGFSESVVRYIVANENLGKPQQKEEEGGDED